MNSRGLKFQEALSNDRNSLFAAPAPAGSVPAVESATTTAKSKRELLWEQKKLARQSKSFVEQAPQRHVSFTQPPRAIDPSTLPPPPFQQEFKPKSRGAPLPGDDFQSLTDTGGSTMNRELGDLFQNPPPYQKYGEVPLEFQEAQKLAPAPPSREQFQRAQEIMRPQPPLAPPQEPLPSKVSAAPPSGNVAKQQYLKELQEQMELKRQKEKQDRQRKIAEEKQKLQQMDRFAPWGANTRNQGPPGNGPRAPPAISNPYSAYAQGPPPQSQMYQQPMSQQFASVQSQPNLLPPTMVDQNYRPPLSPQINNTYTNMPQHHSSQSVGQTAGMNNLAALGGGIVAQPPPPPPPAVYNSFPQQPGYNQGGAMIPQAGVQQNVGFNPAQEYGMQAPQIPINLPSSVRINPNYFQDQQMNGQIREMQRYQYPQSAERVPPREIQPRIERRSKTPLGGAGASTLQSKYVTKVVDQGEEAKKRKQQQEYQELLIQQIEERKRKKREEEQARLEEERKQEEKLERERIQLEEEFKKEQQLKKKKKNEVDEFNAQKWNDHKVMSKNPKAAAKRREAQLFAQKERQERSDKADLFAPAEPKREQVSFVAPSNVERKAELFEPKKREVLSETQIIENVSKKIRGNLDRELEQLRGEMNKKDQNFNQEVNKLKIQAQRAEEEKRRSQLELEELKKQLQENKFRDIKYEHDLAQALRKTEAPPQAQFVAKPTSQLLPVGVQPQPNLLPPKIKGGFQPRYPVQDMGQTGTLHTLKHESQLIPMNAGDRTLNAALQPGAPRPPPSTQMQPPRILANGPLHQQGEMSMSLDNTTRNIQIPMDFGGAKSLRDASDSFPSIPDVNQYAKGGAGAGAQTLDGFTVNSINLQKMNQKNRDRLAGLQEGHGNLSYKPSDPKDELAKLDELLFNILHNDQPGKSRPATQDRKQQAVNFEEEVRGMINDQQAGAGRGVNLNNPEFSLRSLQAEDIQYKQQMAEILNPPTQSFKPITPQRMQSAEASLNIDSFIMPDSTQRIEPLRMQNDDSLQGVNTLSLQGANYLPSRQQTRSSIGGGLRGGERELYSIEEDPLEGSLKVNRE